MEVIHNGIDTNLFHPRADYDVRQKYIIDKNAIMLIAVGNDILSANKGGRYLIDLSRQGKLKNTEIILIGASKPDINEYAKKSNSYKKDSQLIIEDRDHSNKIHLIPLIRDQIELACFYTSANLLVLTSKKETYSLPCAEALCCGTKVVGFRCGAPETIFKRPYAEYVSYGDSAALGNAIREAILKCKIKDNKTNVEDN